MSVALQRQAGCLASGLYLPLLIVLFVLFALNVLIVPIVLIFLGMLPEGVVVVVLELVVFVEVGDFCSRTWCYDQFRVFSGAQVLLLL